MKTPSPRGIRLPTCRVRPAFLVFLAKAVMLASACPASEVDVTRFLENGRTTDSGAVSLAEPALGALAIRGPESAFALLRSKFPRTLQSLPIPSGFSLVLWVRIPSDQPASPLFGLGEPEGDYLWAATDSTGAPTLSFLSQNKLAHFDRAKLGAVNLADGRLHAVVTVVNLNTGLVRMYVDGKPESASTTTLWRPRGVGSAFALYALQGRTDFTGDGVSGLLMPRLIPRELREEEIVQLKPEGGDSETAEINPELGTRLLKETLVEFWPPQFSHQLRWRPL